MDFFISDTHFNHTNILNYERDQFKSIEEHNDFILTEIEKKVHKGDTLWHLGDFGHIDENVYKRFKSLKCEKILIKGNHDCKMNPLKELFDEIISTPGYYYNNRVLLSHYPLPVTKGTINLHGHLHNAVLNFPNYKNLNIHKLDYKLFTDKDLRLLYMGHSKDNWKFLDEWYAEYYLFDDPKRAAYKENGLLDLDKTKLLNKRK